MAPGTVLVVDEAGMAPTRHAALLLGIAENASAKVVAVGDSGQLGSVEPEAGYARSPVANRARLCDKS